MTDRARELVEKLRGSFDYDPGDMQDALHEAADFIEQSLTPPEGDTVSLREALDKQGRALAAWVNILVARTTVGDDGDPVLTGEHSWKRDPTRAEVQAALEAQNGALAALQSRVSPPARMREALEEARRALSAVLGFPKGAALSENALDLCEQAFVGIDAALSTAPIPMSEDAK
jgi:hypothetical protein